MSSNLPINHFSYMYAPAVIMHKTNGLISDRVTLVKKSQVILNPSI